MIKPIITYHPNGNKYYEHYYLNHNLHNDNAPAKIYYDELFNNKIRCVEYYLNNKFLENVSSDDELKKYLKLKNIS